MLYKTYCACYSSLFRGPFFPDMVQIQSAHNIHAFLPRDATQSAVLLWQVVCPSVCPSVRNVEVL